MAPEMRSHKLQIKNNNIDRVKRYRIKDCLLGDI